MVEFKFVDDSCFSDWARDSVYELRKYVSASELHGNMGDVVMGGVGGGMFSPLGNHTKEQAIITMLRIYDCESGDNKF